MPGDDFDVSNSFEELPEIPGYIIEKKNRSRWNGGCV